MTKKSKRTFVLDTNILVYDPNAIFNFAEHDVVIPMTVTEELEHLKNGEETRNYSARQASRTLMSFIKQVKPNEEMWEIPP
jgi:PhoH-like ATPase